MSDELPGAFDPSNFSDDQFLSMMVTATCFAVLLNTIEKTLESTEEKGKTEFSVFLDRSMERVYEESKLVDSTATPQAQQWAYARRQVLLFVRGTLEDIKRNW